MCESIQIKCVKSQASIFYNLQNIIFSKPSINITDPAESFLLFSLNLNWLICCINPRYMLYLSLLMGLIYSSFFLSFRPIFSLDIHCVTYVIIYSHFVLKLIFNFQRYFTQINIQFIIFHQNFPTKKKIHFVLCLILIYILLHLQWAQFNIFLSCN